MEATEFVRNSILDVVVPQNSNGDVEGQLNTAERQVDGSLVSHSLAISIPQREMLYFGERYT